MNAYVRFEEESSVDKALKLNGTLLKELTIRVSKADEKDIDFEKTIFVGNLPFDIREEELRHFCKTVGQVENVRVIRSPLTHMGIGIGYVRFSTK